LVDHHANLLEEIYLRLVDEREIDETWLATQVARLDRTDGDLDTLMMRIAFIRTWTYITHRSGWVRRARTWQDKTQAVEDRLSDALHEALVSRFVARKKAYDEPATPTKPKEAHHPFSELEELKQKLFGGEQTQANNESWGHALADAPTSAIGIDEVGRISFRGRLVARLGRGRTLIEPEVVLSAADLGAGEQARVLRRLRAFAKDLVGLTVGSIDGDAESLSQAARGLVYQLKHELGTVPVKQAA
jgi:ATP-dependent RNA helicase SUPV3L1/SUV3